MPRFSQTSHEFWADASRTIELPEPRFRFDFLPKFFFLGSCFAESVAEVLKSHFFDVVSNPTGTLYHPRAIAETLHFLVGREWDESALFEHQGLWRHPDFPSKLSCESRSRTVERLRNALEESRNALQKSDVLVLTLGTSAAWTAVDSGRFWANCHKLPESRFRRSLSSVEEMTQSILGALEPLSKVRPNLKVVLTVSPVRYSKPDAAENSLNKARLRLVCAEVAERSPLETDYFPAAELILDELRDYRWYAQDCVHPNDAASRYVAARFWEHYAEKELFEYWRQAEVLAKRLGHRSRVNEETNLRVLKTEFASRWPRSAVLGDER